MNHNDEHTQPEPEPDHPTTTDRKRPTKEALRELCEEFLTLASIAELTTITDGHKIGRAQAMGAARAWRAAQTRLTERFDL